MNVLFLTMVKTDIEQRGIYSDLMRMFKNEGHDVYIVMPCERREGKPTSCTEKNGVHYLSVRTLNVQKTNVIEKGLGQVSLEYLYMNAIKKHFGNVKFDLITYSTPPITFTKVIEWAKRQNPEAKTYLQLKDIFPQNAVDLGMLNTHGVKGLLYKQFRKKEEKLYAISDHIGCMSPANVQFVLKNNPHIDQKKVEVCPNSVELAPRTELSDDVKKAILKKYNLPTDRPIFIYGGNLGKPQGIPYLIECLEANKDRNDCHFLVVGTGFEYPRIEKWYKDSNPQAVTLLPGLPKEDYDKLVQACHIGIICLDYRFTIPNFPSRLLSYLEYKMPVLVATDSNCDMGAIAEENKFGVWCPSNNVGAFTASVNTLLTADLKMMGENGYQFLCHNYLVEHSFNAIMKHFK